MSCGLQYMNFWYFKDLRNHWNDECELWFFQAKDSVVGTEEKVKNPDSYRGQDRETQKSREETTLISIKRIAGTGIPGRSRNRLSAGSPLFGIRSGQRYQYTYFSPLLSSNDHRPDGSTHSRSTCTWFSTVGSSYVMVLWARQLKETRQERDSVWNTGEVHIHRSIGFWPKMIHWT